MENRKFQIGDRVRSKDGFCGEVIQLQTITEEQSSCPHHRVRVKMEDNHSLFLPERYQGIGGLIEMEGAEYNFTKA